MSDKVRRRRKYTGLLSAVGAAVLFTGFLLQPETVSAAVTEGMTVFTGKLVPVLFPYMVLSHFFCTYGLLDPLALLLPVGKLFRMDACAFGVFLMGQLCGYPVGAKMAAESVRQGKLTLRQGEVLCAASGGASPAFLVHVTGGMLWGDRRFGVFLLLLQIFIGLTAGILLGRQLPAENSVVREEKEPVPFARCFCEAVGGSVLQLVSIGGYSVFFSLTAALLPFGALGNTLAAAVLEFSTGVRKASCLGGLRGLFLTGFAVGFGGFSVLAQTAHMLSGSGLSLRPYVLCKLLSGFIIGLAAVGYGCFFPAAALYQNAAAGMAMAGRTTDLVWFAGILVMMRYFSWRYRGVRR